MSTQPGLPDVLKSPTSRDESKVILWVLHYRQGQNPSPMQKNFESAGTIARIVDRAKRHCDAMGYRFIKVQPFLSNLQTDENQAAGID